jgi:electron transfer flavoprotein alpha subunit
VTKNLRITIYQLPITNHMAILVFTEAGKGKIRKSSLEAVNYASHIAEKLGTTVTAVIDGSTDAAILADLGKAGAKKVLTISDAKLKDGNPRAWAIALDQAAVAEGANVVIFSHDLVSKSVAPRLAVRMKAGVVAGAVDFPTIEGGKFSVRKTAFSGKATAVYSIHSDKKIITLLPNSFPIKLADTTAEVTSMSVDLSAAEIKVTVKELKTRDTSKISLPEAELVVSAGRGMKDPKNW